MSWPSGKRPTVASLSLPPRASFPPAKWERVILVLAFPVSLGKFNKPPSRAIRRRTTPLGHLGRHWLPGAGDDSGPRAGLEPQGSAGTQARGSCQSRAGPRPPGRDDGAQAGASTRRPPRALGTDPGHRSSGAPLPPGRRAEHVMRPRFPCPEPRQPAGPGSPAPLRHREQAPSPARSRGPAPPGLSFPAGASSPQAERTPRPPALGLTGRRGTISTEQQWQK